MRARLRLGGLLKFSALYGESFVYIGEGERDRTLLDRYTVYIRGR